MASNIQPTGLDWKNLPDKTTPISAENLNKMANTIDDLVEAVNPLNTVEANPTGTPTEGLEKVEIDGTLYEVKGGHKILNDSGTTLTQKDNLQFKGVYTQNNGDNTEVDICRTMTKAQMEALSGESLKGFINTSDEPDSLPLTAEWVAYDSNTSVKEKIDDIEEEIETIDGKTAYDIPFTNVTSTGNKIQELSIQSARVLKAFTWNYTAQSFDVVSSETFILYGARAGRGLLYIVPINNNEICEVYDGFGVTVTHTASADMKTHTISISAPSATAGSTCQIFAIGRNI